VRKATKKSSKPIVPQPNDDGNSDEDFFPIEEEPVEQEIKKKTPAKRRNPPKKQKITTPIDVSNVEPTISGFSLQYPHGFAPGVPPGYAFQPPPVVPAPVPAIPREQFDEYVRTVGNLANTIRGVGEEVSSAIRRLEERLDASDAVLAKNTSRLKQICKILEEPHLSPQWYLDFSTSIKKTMFFDPSGRFPMAYSGQSHSTPVPFPDTNTAELDMFGNRPRSFKTPGKSNKLSHY
jgi:hypothetical protein